jgi:hypothetical protein
MYRADGANVLYIHEVNNTEEVFLTTHPTADCVLTPEQQAKVLADQLNVRDAMHRLQRETPPKPAYNDGYTHEALHAVHILAETFGDHVIDTPCAEQFPDVASAADAIHQAMFDLYQLIGTKFSDVKT